MGEILHAELEPLRGHDLVGDIRGAGLLAGIELVRDKATRQPFPRAWKVAEMITAKSLENGLVVWNNVGHIDGAAGDLILLAPPFIIEPKEIKHMIALFRQAMDRVAESVYQQKSTTSDTNEDREDGR
jgi:adenosylmethionine-8-amino-7-oxononanoate aminotransferase